MSAPTYVEWLTRRAKTYLEVRREIPDDLMMEMVAAGIDVPKLERQYRHDSALSDYPDRSL